MTSTKDPPRVLRVAMVVGGSVISERTVDTRSPVRFDVPDAGPLTLMEPTSDGGWEVLLDPQMRGAIWNAKGRRSVAAMRGERVKVGPNDYGVLTIGASALFFQRVNPAERLPRFLGIDPNALSSLTLSTFLHAAALLLLFMAQRETPASAELELPADLIRRFMVTPIEPAAAPDVEAPNADAPTSEAAAEAAASGSEGARMPERGDRAGSRRPAPGPEPGGVAAPDVGLLRAIRGPDGDGNALAAALEGPDVAGLLAGVRSGTARPGRGRGLGLRGVGRGRGPGRRVGAGPIETDLDGQDGPPAGEGGRARGEVRVTLPPPPPTRGPGYLPPDAILRVLRRNQAAIRYCYEASLQRRPELAGRVLTAWRIERDGRVSGARVARSTLGDARAEGCMARQIRGWRFPQPDGGVVDVQFPWILGLGGT